MQFLPVWAGAWSQTQFHAQAKLQGKIAVLSWLWFWHSLSITGTGTATGCNFLLKVWNEMDALLEVYDLS